LLSALKRGTICSRPAGGRQMEVGNRGSVVMANMLACDPITKTPTKAALKVTGPATRCMNRAHSLDHSSRIQLVEVGENARN
jgi:hypothetical protein